MNAYNLLSLREYLIIISLKSENVEPWYESNLLSAIIGAIIAIVTTLITIYISNRQKKIDDRKNTIILITQTNQELFSYIYKVSLDKGNLNHTKFRELIKNFSVIYILPKDIKLEFEKIIKIYMLSPQNFCLKSEDIYTHCKNIVACLDKYGADIFNE